MSRIPSLDERLKNYQPFWINWNLDEFISKGTFGAVYKLHDPKFNDYSALKVITIDRAGQSGLRSGAKHNAMQFMREQAENEIALMTKLKHCPYIVHCNNYEFKEHRNSKNELVLFDILIHMDLFTCLEENIKENDLILSEAEVIKIGKQIGEALKAAHGLGIMHRDIKPANIYINGIGNYLLGDLGVSKQLENNSYSTMAGTPEYMAPEIYHANTYNRYNHTADLYSLGLVLYTFLNNNFPPFVDENSTYEQTSEAIFSRLNGDPLPPPANGSAQLKKVILKACSYNPADRYQTADEFLVALEAAERGGSAGSRPTGGFAGSRSAGSSASSRSAAAAKKSASHSGTTYADSTSSAGGTTYADTDAGSGSGYARPTPPPPPPPPPTPDKPVTPAVKVYSAPKKTKAEKPLVVSHKPINKTPFIIAGAAAGLILVVVLVVLGVFGTASAACQNTDIYYECGYSQPLSPEAQSSINSADT